MKGFISRNSIVKLNSITIKEQASNWVLSCRRATFLKHEILQVWAQQNPGFHFGQRC